METSALVSWTSAKGRKMSGKRMREKYAMEVKMRAGVNESGSALP